MTEPAKRCPFCHEAISTWNTCTHLRPNGEWRLYEDEDTNAWECSVCHEVWQLMDGTPEENNMHYCHNCGARMETCYHKKGEDNESNTTDEA